MMEEKGDIAQTGEATRGGYCETTLGLGRGKKNYGPEYMGNRPETNEVRQAQVLDFKGKKVREEGQRG